MVTNFVPLRCRSNYSFLHGAATLDQLLERAAREGMGALGLADLGGLYGVIQFFGKSSDYGIKPIIGVELATEAGTILFIAKDLKGYGNLCRLSTIAKLDERTPTLEDILRHHEGVIAVAFDTVESAGLAGTPSCQLGRRQERVPDAATAMLERLEETFHDDLYLGLVSFNDLRSKVRIQRDVRAARRLGVKSVAANPIAFMSETDYPVHRVLRAIDEIVPVDQLPEDSAESPSAYFTSKAESLQLFSELPHAISATLEIAEKCEVKLPMGRLNFPIYENTTGKTNSRLLHELASSGLQRRYRRLNGEAVARLEYELNVIERTGFVDYFLIVRDIIGFCEKNGIPCVGRGSAASSIVSFCLGITEVDPIEQDLYFPRFLNEARSDPPDIDIDLCWKRRDDVLEYVYEKYGRNRVAMICTLNTFAVRAAVHEVAKAFGLSGDEISDFTRRLPWGGSVGELRKRMTTNPECRHLPIDTEPYRTIIEISARIEGYPRHLGVHCGGIVISPGELLDLVPLQVSAKGIAITQYDMYSIGDLGLVKIDLLGQRGLSTIEEAKDIIRKKTGSRPEYIPDNDPDTYRLLQQGKTIGIFQIESPGLRALLIAMHPRRLNDITLALALIRPGASESGMKKAFLERLFGKWPVEYAHALLEPVLKETLGNIIYQEQVLKVAEAMAGFTPEQGDLLRRAITKDRTNTDFALMREAFFKQSARRGVSHETAAAVFDIIAQFASFGFCKAHAATYAVLSYRGSYLKAHHPIEYMAAMLNNFAGYYKPRVYAEEARRWGAVLKTPTVDRPSDVCFVDGKDFYVGLLFVKNLSGATIEHIRSARANGPFRDLFDFLKRVRPSLDEAENLIKCGALDCLGQMRPQLLWLQKMYGEKRLKAPDDLPVLDGLAVPEPAFLPDLPDFDIDQRLKAEAEILEMSISCHPTQRLGITNNHVKSVDLPKLENRRVKIAGFVADRKRIKTANGKNMVFLSMEDEFDMFEVTLFPEIYQRVGERIFRKPLLDIEGTVQTDSGGLTVVAERVEVVG